MKEIEGTRGRVFTENGKIYTESFNPGVRVYGERLVSANGSEFREWNPNRSKYSAYISCGGKAFPFRKDSKVLYLGAASGTTASHISDIVPDGKVYCIEFSPRSFRDLVKTSDGRSNMNPILGDATDPDSYGFLVEHVDVVYSDVAQKRQAEILVSNMERYCARFGILCVKARSEDVTLPPEKVFDATKDRLKNHGLRILDMLDIGRFEKDHCLIVVEKLRSVYTVAFRDGKFLMVHNKKRNGWEMPGGKIEKDESIEDAARREFCEEAGFDIAITGTSNIGYCDVCAGILGEKNGTGEMESALFETLPDELSFETDEYERVIEWARTSVAEQPGFDINDENK